jgi:hypothetical protein
MNCTFCNKEINNVGSLTAHEKCCRGNPNAVKYKRSIHAGAKKGCTSWSTGKKIGRLKHWDEKYPLEGVLVENSTYARHNLKKRIIDNNLIEYRCACCGIEAVWNGKPMPLILDHINGINNDNRLDNLRFVCSNCDSQLPTYKSRNK